MKKLYKSYTGMLFTLVECHKAFSKCHIAFYIWTNLHYSLTKMGVSHSIFYQGAINNTGEHVFIKNTVISMKKWVFR
jgi:hypothetical protein